MPKSKKSKPSFGIVGLGSFGAALAIELAERGMDLVVLDRDENKIREFREITENAIVVKNLSKKTLESTGIGHCDVAVVCIGEQLDTSVLATLHLVGMGIPLVLAKAQSGEHGEILEKIGAEVIYPERDMAIRLASRLRTAKVVDFIQLSEKLNISKIPAPACLWGKSVLEVNLRRRFGQNIIALENNGEVLEMLHPEYVFRQGDVLFVSGCREGLLQMTDWLEQQ